MVLFWASLPVLITMDRISGLVISSQLSLALSFVLLTRCSYLYLAGVGVVPGCMLISWLVFTYANTVVAGSLPSYLPNQYTRQTSTLLHSETHIVRPNSFPREDGRANLCQWTLDTTSGELKPTWINADSSGCSRSHPHLHRTHSLAAKSKTYLWLQAGIIYAGGDPKAFSAKYTQSIQEIVRTFHYCLSCLLIDLTERNYSSKPISREPDLGSDRSERQDGETGRWHCLCASARTMTT